MAFNKNSPSMQNEDAENALKEKDAKVADLSARLDDKEKMVIALRSAARKRELAELTPETSSAEFKLQKNGGAGHQSNDSNSSSLTSQATSVASPLSPTTPISPMALLTPQKQKPKVEVSTTTEKKGNMKRKSVDEVSKMLDEMIQDKVESGHLVKSRTGSVRIAVPTRTGSRNQTCSRQPSHSSTITAVPGIGSLAERLREGDSIVEPRTAI